MSTKSKTEETTKTKTTQTTISFRELLPLPKVSTKIFVHSISRPSVFGIDQWINDSSGKRMKKTKLGDRANDKYPVFYSPKVGGLLNGLSYKEWTYNGLQVVNDDKRPMNLQDKMEIKWGLSSGTLSNKAWKKGDSVREADMTYYQKQVWALRDGSTMFDTGNMDDDLAYYAFLDHKFVANSEADYRSGKSPKASHYIAHEGESDNLKFKKSVRKAKAIALLVELDLPTRRKITHTLELASTRVTLSEEQIHNLLFDYLDKTNYQPNSNLDKFLELANLSKSPTGREQLEARYIIKKALDSRIIYEKQGAYNYPRKEGLLVLGENLPEAVEFILNPKKQAIVEDLELAVKAKLA